MGRRVLLTGLILLHQLIWLPAPVESKYREVIRNLTCYHFEQTVCTSDQGENLEMSDPYCRVAQDEQGGTKVSDQCHQCGIKEIWREGKLEEILRWCLVNDYHKDECEVTYEVYPDKENTVWQICRCSEADKCNGPALPEMGKGRKGFFAEYADFPKRPTYGEKKSATGKLQLSAFVFAVPLILIVFRLL